MIIFKERVSGDEMFSDTYQMADEEDGEIVRVTGKLTTERTEIDESTFGGNKSAEGGGDDEGADASSVSGINVILQNRLVETGFGKKKEFQVYAKDYMGKVIAHLEEQKASEERIKKFKKGAVSFVKRVCEDFKDWQFFMGESMNADGGMAYVHWDGETPYVYFLRAALEEEKV